MTISSVLEVPTFLREARPPAPAPVNGRAAQVARTRVSRRKVVSTLGVLLRRSALVVACLGAVGGLAQAEMRPYVTAADLAHQTEQCSQEMRAAEAQSDVLRLRIATLESPDGERNEARRYGFVLPNEVAIACSVPHTPLATTSDADLMRLPTEPRPGLLERVRRLLEW